MPCVGVFQDVLLVKRTDLTADEEIPVLLHYAGENGFTRSEIGQNVRRPAPRITEARQRLEAFDCRQILLFGTDGIGRRISVPGISESTWPTSFWPSSAVRRL